MIFSRLAFRYGMRVSLCLLAFGPAAFSQWRTGYYMQDDAGVQTAATIPWTKYTHVIHYALKPIFRNGVCGWDKKATDFTARNIKTFVNHAHAASVKAIIGISEDDSLKAIKACTTPEKLPQFVALISGFVEEHHYDGVDIEWGNGIVSAIYTAQYQNFIRALRAAMPTVTLSVPMRITDSYVAPVAEELDQINLMAYGLDIYSLPKAEPNHWQHGSKDPQSKETSDNAVDPAMWSSLARMGIATNKIGLGIPFYGRIEHGCLEPTGRIGMTDPDQISLDGISSHLISYRDLVNSPYWLSGAHVWDELQQSQYIRYTGGSCRTDAFIPYGGPEQMEAAAAEIKANGLGGIMAYGLPYEYISTQGADARYPLSTAFYHAIVDSPSEPVTSKPSHIVTLAVTAASALADSTDSTLKNTTAPTALAAPSPLHSASATADTTGETFTYYVDSTNGSDGNPGTLTKPWKTIAKVNLAKLMPGQSVAFKRGGLWRETLQPGQSGVPGKPITFGAYGIGNQPIINGSNIISSFSADSTSRVWEAKVPVRPYAVWIDKASPGTPAATKAALTSRNPWFWKSGTLYIYSTTNPSLEHSVEAGQRDYAIFVNQVNYITLTELNATNANDRSIYLRNCTAATLHAVTAHDSADQAIMIGIGGGSHTISNSNLYNSGLGGTFGTGSGLHIQNTTLPSTIQYTYIHDYGIVGGDHDVYDESGGNTYSHNHFKAPAGALGMAMNVDSQNTTIIYNIFESIPAGGIYLYKDPSNTKIYNNTFYDCGTASPYTTIWLDRDSSATNIEVKNNVTYVASGYSVGFIADSTSAGWASDYNDVFVNFFGVWKQGPELNWSTWRSTSGQDAHSLISNPLFTNPKAGGFTLQAGSPAIAAGVYIPGVSTSTHPNIGAE